MTVTRCFGKATAAKHITGNNANRLQAWIDEQQRKPVQFTDHHLEQLSSLLPLLLCGEQSAQMVFNQEILRLQTQQIELTPSFTQSQQQSIVTTLVEVESDECRHDIALQQVADQLPILHSYTQAQRKAQLFYSQLGRVDNYSEHFVKIAVLDTCVTQIMHAFESSSLGRQHRFSQLCGLIKKDEAKHVYISRQHAQALGATSRDFNLAQQQVSHDLFALLCSQDHAFEQMGICLDDIQQKLEAKWR
ncbi:hypothetical protein [Shewanella maritima]|uniref:hypothetical protein n=1 Tax=Shewanella maritima TaxID=2520507 RepID=UPI0037361161